MIINAGCTSLAFVSCHFTAKWRKSRLGLRTRAVFYGLRYVTVRAVTVTYGSLEQKFYGRFHTGRNRIRNIGYVPYTAAYGIRLFLS